VLIMLAAVVGLPSAESTGIGGGSILAPVLIGSGRPPKEVAPAALAINFRDVSGGRGYLHDLVDPSSRTRLT